jgi:RND family efflux transporter MFP subunit
MSREKSARAALDQSMAEVQVAESGVNAEKINVQLANQNENRVMEQTSMLRIFAPIDGVVIKRNVGPGTPIRPDDGTPLFVIARSERLIAVTHLPENQAALVDIGDPATIRLSSPGNDPIAGRVSGTAFEIDPASGTLRVEIEIPNSNGRLRPGMSGQATILLETRPNTLVIPERAIQEFRGTRSCSRVVDRRIVNTPIKLGRANQSQGCEVLEGLTESDEVVMLEDFNQASLLRFFSEHGTRVETIQSEPKGVRRPR